ncbi:glycosyltransferase family 2 protein [Pluralibacter gergoviae]|uniref:glycosyltransferase family 2 protein n=1 Tax=Pluralibacter gergoviae TaxID=61647 RepID=UPI00090820B1|nr:glycosyltransferase family 2 protein [Pluralibacter gergoviae]
MKVGIVATLKNESEYLIEWISYHLSIGVDCFYLANNNSDDNTEEILKTLQRKGVVKYLNFPTTPDYNGSPQIDIYNKLGHEFKSEVDWLCFIDADEFIVLDDDNKDIHCFLNHFDAVSNIGSVVVFWALYGSSFNVNKEKKLSIERFFLRDEKPNQHYKSFVKSIAFNGFKGNPHYSHLKDGYHTVNTDNRILNGIDLSGIAKNFAIRTWNNIRINHYAIRSLEEFTLKKQKRGRATTAQKRFDNYFIIHDKNTTVDYFSQTKIAMTKEIINNIYELDLNDSRHADSRGFRYTSIGNATIVSQHYDEENNVYIFKLLVHEIPIFNLFLFNDFEELLELSYQIVEINHFTKKQILQFEINKKYICSEYVISYICFNRAGNNLGHLIKINNTNVGERKLSVYSLLRFLKAKLKTFVDNFIISRRYNKNKS